MPTIFQWISDVWTVFGGWVPSLVLQDWHLKNALLGKIGDVSRLGVFWAMNSTRKHKIWRPQVGSFYGAGLGNLRSEVCGILQCVTFSGPKTTLIWEWCAEVCGCNTIAGHQSRPEKHFATKSMEDHQKKLRPKFSRTSFSSSKSKHWPSWKSTQNFSETPGWFHSLKKTVDV